MTTIHAALLDVDPALLPGRAVSCLDELLDLIAAGEVGACHEATGDGEQEVTHLDSLELVEADLVPRRHAECAVWLMLGARENGAVGRKPVLSSVK